MPKYWAFYSRVFPNNTGTNYGELNLCNSFSRNFPEYDFKCVQRTKAFIRLHLKNIVFQRNKSRVLRIPSVFYHSDDSYMYVNWNGKVSIPDLTGSGSYLDMFLMFSKINNFLWYFFLPNLNILWHLKSKIKKLFWRNCILDNFI